MIIIISSSLPLIFGNILISIQKKGEKKSVKLTSF